MLVNSESEIFGSPGNPGNPEKLQKLFLSQTTDDEKGEILALWWVHQYGGRLCDKPRKGKLMGWEQLQNLFKTPNVTTTLDDKKWGQTRLISGILSNLADRGRIRRTGQGYEPLTNNNETVLSNNELFLRVASEETLNALTEFIHIHKESKKPRKVPFCKESWYPVVTSDGLRDNFKDTFFIQWSHIISRELSKKLGLEIFDNMANLLRESMEVNMARKVGFIKTVVVEDKAFYHIPDLIKVPFHLRSLQGKELELPGTHSQILLKAMKLEALLLHTKSLMDDVRKQEKIKAAARNENINNPNDRASESRQQDEEFEEVSA